MANAQGFNETVIIGPETSISTPPSPPVGDKLPVSNVSFRPSQNRFYSDALTGGAEARPPVDGKHAGDFSYDLECSDISLGMPLHALFGTEADQGAAANYDHIYRLGTLGSHYGEQQFSDIAKYFAYTGLRHGTGSFMCSPEGIMKATFGGKYCTTVTPQGSAYTTGTITDRTGNLPFSYVVATLKYKGSAFAIASDIKWDIDRGLEHLFAIDGTTAAMDIASKIPTVKGSFTIYVQDSTVFEDALASTEVAIEVLVPHPTTGYGVKVNFPTCKLKPSGPVTNGAGGQITGTFDFDAYARGSASNLPGFLYSKGFTTALVTAGDTLIWNIDGGGDLTTTLTTGAARTIAQWKTDIDATTGFSSVATCVIENNRLLIASKATTGSSSSVKVRNGTGTPATTLLFQTGTAKVGLDSCSIRVILTNAIASH